KMNWRKIGKAAIIILAGLTLLTGVFIVGVNIGKKYYPSINLVRGVKNLETDKPADVDFSLFWDAWRLIQNDYVKSDALNKQAMVYGAVRGLLSSLGDPYSTFFDPKEAEKFSANVTGSFSGIGIEIGVKKGILTIISPIEGTPAWEAGLKPGDQIVEIDGKESLSMSSEEAVDLIRGPKDTEVKLTIFRSNFEKPQEFTIKRDTISVPSIKTEFIQDNIAHITLSGFSDNTNYEFYRAVLEALVKKSPAVILDLRNNPGGYLEVSVDIAGWFLKRGDVVVRESVKGEDETVFLASGNQALLNTPVVILVNEGSASASEILAGALRDNRRIKIVGQKTFGKGSVQEVEDMPDNSMIKLTIAEWLTPNGLSLNGNGLEPDYKVGLTDEDYENDKDPQLNKALEVVQQLIAQ
ncbi:MAG: S41 family peptidase, partial [bacterium]|nr:S41 family peptidase [bacterium]